MEYYWIRSKTTSNNQKRTLRIMKVLFTFLFAALLSINAHTYSQETINLSVENKSLKEVFSEIEKKSSYIFLFSGNVDSEMNRKVSIKALSESLDNVMNSVTRNTELKYSILDKQIIVYKNESAEKREESISSLQQNTITITGRVLDTKKEPLAGVSIRVKNTQQGTSTDSQGNFSITLRSSVNEYTILIISYIGFKTKEIEVKNVQHLNIVMEEDISEIGEVVITGYANVRKESFTGSITQIKQEDILKVSPGNLISTIQAFDPSFKIMDNIATGSNPNALPEFYIRGQSGLPNVKELDILESSNVSQFSLKTNPNTPIFILDGFEVGIEKIYDLDITRIKSITLLKDASSSAIYGSRAANGVIVLETLAPKPGKIKINYSGSYGLTTPDLSSYNLMNGKEKILAEQAANFFGEPEPWEYKDRNYDFVKRLKNINYIRKKNQLLQGVDTYWLSQPLNTAFNHKHNLFVEGGLENFRYGIEIQYDKENGIMKKSYRNKTGIGLAMEYIHKKLQIRNNINFNMMARQNSPYGSFDSYIRLQPYYEPFDIETGEIISEYNQLWGSNRNIKNPLFEALLGNFDKGNYREWTNNLSLNWFLTQHLLIKGQYAITYNDANADLFTDPASTKYSKTEDLLRRGELRTSNTKRLNHNMNFFAAYNQGFKKHYINLSLGMNVVSTSFDYESYYYRGFADKNFSSPAYASEVVGAPTFNDNITRLFGTFFTANYSYQNIYLIDTSVRIDGSSEFGDERKWAPFWSLGGGINFHNYPILKGNNNVSLLRITGNIGQTGKSNFSPFMSNNMFEIMKDDWYPTGIGAKLIYLGNKNLTWEKTISNNIGIDITLKKRYSLRMDFYRKTTKDLISDVSLPSSSGFNVYKDNIGEITNSGFEAKVNLGVLKTKDANIYLFANIAHNINRINKISESLKKYNERIDEYFKGYVSNDDPEWYTIYNSSNSKYSKPIKRFEEGNSITAIYGMKSLGVNPANGKEVFYKKDGTITYDWSSTEQQIIGNTEPWGQGSFGLNAQYKRWSLFTTFLYEFGGDRYNQTLVSEVENIDLMHSNADKRVGLDRWKVPGDITPLKNIKDGLVTTRVSSRFIQRNNYVKFNSISLGYDVDHNILKRYGINLLRLQINMNDIALFSTIRREMGTSYPFARTFTFTLNTAF